MAAPGWSWSCARAVPRSFLGETIVLVTAVPGLLQELPDFFAAACFFAGLRRVGSFWLVPSFFLARRGYQHDGMLLILVDEAEFSGSNADSTACCNELPGSQLTTSGNYRPRRPCRSCSPVEVCEAGDASDYAVQPLPSLANDRGAFRPRRSRFRRTIWVERIRSGPVYRRSIAGLRADHSGLLVMLSGFAARNRVQACAVLLC